MRMRTKSSLRGLRDIRTRSGRVDRSDVPYMAYMKISCLEMEKARREKEKASSETRIRNIDGRLAQIETEKAGILVRLGERCPETSPQAAGHSTRPGQITIGDKKKGFKIRY